MKFNKEDEDKVTPCTHETEVMMKDKNFESYFKPRNGMRIIGGDTYHQTEFFSMTGTPEEDSGY